MKKLWCCLLLCCISLFGKEDLKSLNLLKSPLQISNAKTTTFKDGVYTVVNPAKGIASRMYQDVTLDQKTVVPLTFAVEVMAKENVGNSGCLFGILLDLVHTDGSKTPCVNMGAGSDTFDWHLLCRTYVPKKPVKSLRYTIQYVNSKGVVSFRKPMLFSGIVQLGAKQAKPLTPLQKARLRFKNEVLTLKDRHLDTFLVRAGRPSASIVGDAALAARLNEVLKAKTGAELPVLPHTAYENAEKLDQNLILIGNRDRNRSISNLYSRHFTLLDARYPGEGGSEVRSLHNPFGDHHNVIFCGGSDLTGDQVSVDKLVSRLQALPAGKDLKLGFISDATLSPKYKVSRNIKDIPLWEESFGYKNQGYFGWNCLAKCLAMLYITNAPYYKDEFMRLAFPKDKATRDELFKLDDEAYHNRRNPIVTVYHYRGPFMTLYWDLVDENPLFTDAERLKVTQTLHDQLIHRLTRNDFTNPSSRYGSMKLVRPDRHATWEALLIWITSRFLDKDYPCEATKAGLQVGRNAMEPLYTYALNGEIPLYWLTTSIELQFFYASLQGHRLVGNPRLRDYARCLTVMSDLNPGATDRTGRYSSIWTLLAGAYFAQDEAMVQLARAKAIPGTGKIGAGLKYDYSIFRLGQSYWPVKPYPHNSIVEPLGRWTTYTNSIPATPEKTCILYTSYRSKPDNTGDYLMVDPHYAHGVREPQHNFSLAWANIKGSPLLRGFENALIPFANELADLRQPMNGEVVSQGTSGNFVWISGRVRDLNGFDWERTWVLRKETYLVAVDTLTAKRDMTSARFDNRLAAGPGCEGISLLPNGDCCGKIALGNMVWSCSADADRRLKPVKWSVYLSSDNVTFKIGRNRLKAGDRIQFATLVRIGGDTRTPSTAQQGHEVALLTPEPAMLTFTPDGFNLTSATESFTLKGTEGQGSSQGDAACVDKARKMLAERKPMTMPRIVFPSAPVAEQWQGKVSGAAGLIVLGDGQMAVSADNTVTVFDRTSGKTCFSRTMNAEVSAMCYVPGVSLWLIGCKDETLHALTNQGKEAWTFTSVMAPEMEFNGPYHHKSAVPGIRSLGVHNGMVYVGSAGTLEVLDYKGGLIKRTYVLYGAVDEQIPIPGTKDVVLRRHIGGWPDAHRVTPELKPRLMGWCSGMFDNLGSFGFSQINKEAVVFFRNSSGTLMAADMFCGVQNRLVLRGMDGRAQYEANFGGAGSATNISHLLGRRAMQTRSLRDVVVADLDADKSPEILVSHTDRALYVFNERLQLKTLIHLPDVPRKSILGDASFLVGLDDGSILRVGADLKPVRIAQVKGTVLDMKRLGDSLYVCTAEGQVRAFKLK